MKNILILLSFLPAISFASPKTPAFSRCTNEIIEAAQANIDLKARAYKVRGLTGGRLISETWQQLSHDPKGSLKAFVRARIHQSAYEVEVSVDSWCSVESVLIRDMGDI